MTAAFAEEVAARGLPQIHGFGKQPIHLRAIKGPLHTRLALRAKFSIIGLAHPPLANPAADGAKGERHLPP